MCTYEIMLTMQLTISLVTALFNVFFSSSIYGQIKQVHILNNLKQLAKITVQRHEFIFFKFKIF